MIADGALEGVDEIYGIHVKSTLYVTRAGVAIGSKLTFWCPPSQVHGRDWRQARALDGLPRPRRWPNRKGEKVQPMQEEMSSWRFLCLKPFFLFFFLL